MSEENIKLKVEQFISSFENKDQNKLFSILQEFNPQRLSTNEPPPKPLKDDIFPIKCAVCETRLSESNHFGAPTCNACYKFFQRSASSTVPFTEHSHPKQFTPE